LTAIFRALHGFISNEGKFRLAVSKILKEGHVVRTVYGLIFDPEKDYFPNCLFPGLSTKPRIDTPSRRLSSLSSHFAQEQKNAAEKSFSAPARPSGLR
jgi:hypothetical protein